MLDPISFLTPHKVTLAILVRLSVQHDDDDDSEMERQAWLELALYLVEEVRSSAQYFEKSLDDVLLDLAGMDPTVLSQSLTDELDKMDSPDALFSFLQVSLKEVSGDDAVRVERNSVFDVFIRKVLLSFNSMPFERFAALYTDLAAYNQAAKDVGMERDDEEEGQEERPPPLSVDDLQAHVHREARLLEVSTEPLELEHLETDIAAMMCVPLSRARAALPSAALAGPFEPAQDRSCVCWQAAGREGAQGAVPALSAGDAQPRFCPGSGRSASVLRHVRHGRHQRAVRGAQPRGAPPAFRPPRGGDARHQRDGAGSAAVERRDCAGVCRGVAPASGAGAERHAHDAPPA
jgi:hypothetical protein